ncbi:MAG TPA: helix-turn-helix domain-containing protein [Frankiaceae bacterium]|nr:helix-turn-helix domain-containing protein [Frankiaceae bacterium]
MTSAGTVPEVLARRPKRADAQRNYQLLLEAAREGFGEGGVSTSLEDIARRAGVGIGTLYRHFPTRQDLFEAVYVNEVVTLCESAEGLTALSAWDALVTWLRRVVRYAATKRAIAEELTASGGGPSPLFLTCRQEINKTGEPMLKRAQDAGVARADATFDDVLRMISGMTMVTFVEPGQLERVLEMIFDGLRRQPTAN